MIGARLVRIGAACVLVFVSCGVLQMMTAESARAGRYNTDCREVLKVGSTNTYGFIMALLDSDTLVDIAAVGEGPNQLLVYHNNGNNFSTLDSITLDMAPWTVEDVDLDGDSDRDLVVGYRDSAKVQAFFNDGSGSFSAGASLAIGNGSTYQTVYYLEAEDYDSDGTPEIMAAISSSTSVISPQFNGVFHIVYDTSSSSFAVDTVRLWHDLVSGDLPYPWHIHSGDLNGDGHRDLAISGDSLIEIYLNDPTANAVDPPFVSTDSTLYGAFGLNAHALYECDLIDANHDGLLDVIATDYAFMHWFLLLNDSTYGSVPFSSNDSIAFSGYPSMAELAVADYFSDANGYQDVAVSRSTDTAAIHFWRSTTSSPWFEAVDSADIYFDPSENVYWVKPRDIVWGGDIDLVFSGTEGVSVMTNGGICGDLNYDGTVDAVDLGILIDFAFNNGSACPLWTDVDGNGTNADIVDVNYLINYLFHNGPDPVCS